MNAPRRNEQERMLFRLDFALRGHAAYTHPQGLEGLVALLESARSCLGAPLLCYLEDMRGAELFGRVCEAESATDETPGCGKPAAAKVTLLRFPHSRPAS